jgi:ResB-like family protein
VRYATLTPRIRAAIWSALTSLKLTLVCLALLMVLVVWCTLAQVRMGTVGAVSAYIRSPLVWWEVPGSALEIPIFPGGALVGSVLTLNLLAAQMNRLELSWRKSGLWVVHAGLILLFVGEFVTSAFQVETRLSIEEGQTVDFVESPRQMELALTDVTDPTYDEVYGIPESLLASSARIDVKGTPVSLRVTPVSADNQVGVRAVYVETTVDGRRYGPWLVSNALGAPQSFIHQGRNWTLSMRPRREYLPYSLTLKKFRHDTYPGTDIPKNFSSLVQLRNPGRGEDRDVLIYMNQPLRYDGKAFYQASFGKNDTLSVLQVVENPGWLLPYISCVLVATGLLLHFVFALFRSLRRASAVRAGAVVVL